ncbi:MAG: HEAT repeat domain-containing protein [Candidatus Omnitrophica bacterium]|nr:HEAT repeat domain-containing protein [Candidatus Omnitrophota bacterium]
MSMYMEKHKTSLVYRLLSAFIAFTFLFSIIAPPGAYAQNPPQSILNLPQVGTMVSVTGAFAPSLVKGITIYPENPLEFDFIISKGDHNLEGEAFNKESTKLIKYFLAALTTPDEEMWVNLSPYEKDRIIPESFGDTELGRDLLAQDYMLKQLSASLMYPEDEVGQKFWARVHKKAKEMYGVTEIPMNTFNKIWIVPEKAVVYEKDASAFVIDSHLKVMLEEDYVALQNNVGVRKFGLDSVVQEDAEIISGVSSEIIREILIPEIEKEVNEGETFAMLRQVYNSVILATWYKDNLKESLLGQVYVDQAKTRGVDTQDKEINRKIYDQYVEAFKKGVYNYIKEDYDAETNELIPRKYFSGGNNLSGTRALRQDTTAASPVLLAEQKEDTQNVKIILNEIGSSSPVTNGELAAMTDQSGAQIASSPVTALKDVGKVFLALRTMSQSLQNEALGKSGSEKRSSKVILPKIRDVERGLLELMKVLEENQEEVGPSFNTQFEVVANELDFLSIVRKNLEREEKYLASSPETASSPVTNGALAAMSDTDQGDSQAMLSDEDITRYFHLLFNSEKERMRIAIVEVLGTVSDAHPRIREIENKLFFALTMPGVNPNVREAVAKSLNRIGTSNAKRLLRTAAESLNQEVRDVVKAANPPPPVLSVVKSSDDLHISGKGLVEIDILAFFRDYKNVLDSSVENPDDALKFLKQVTTHMLGFLRRGYAISSNSFNESARKLIAQSMPEEESLFIGYLQGAPRGMSFEHAMAYVVYAGLSPESRARVEENNPGIWSDMSALARRLDFLVDMHNENLLTVTEENRDLYLDSEIQSMLLRLYDITGTVSDNALEKIDDLLSLAVTKEYIPVNVVTLANDWGFYRPRTEPFYRYLKMFAGAINQKELSYGDIQERVVHLAQEFRQEKVSSSSPMTEGDLVAKEIAKKYKKLDAMKARVTEITAEIERLSMSGVLISPELTRLKDERSALLIAQSVILEEITVKLQPTSSPASSDEGLATSDKYGGINLNPELLDMQIKRDGAGVPLPLPMQPIESMRIDGFIPIIINVTPVSLPMLLGVLEQPEEPSEMSYHQIIDPLDIKARFVTREKNNFKFDFLPLKITTPKIFYQNVTNRTTDYSGLPVSCYTARKQPSMHFL